MFLVNSRFPLVCDTSSSSRSKFFHSDEVILLPKLRMQFAEFLNHSSPNRLGILYLSTCVGLGYGHRESSLAAFLGSIGSMTSSKSSRRRISGFVGTGFAWDPPYILTPPLPSGGFIYLPASPLCWPLHCGSVPLGAVLRAPSIPLATTVKPGRAHSGTGISTGCASTTPFGLALAPDSPWED